MQVSDETINQMLKNLPPDQQDSIASILRGEVAYQVVCNTKDQFEDREVPVLGENNEVIVYKSGKNKGEPKFTKERVLVQEGTNGRVIANIMTDGQVVPVTDERGRVWLRASRRRTDGELGFECWCGQDSRIAPNEDGVLKADGSQPSKEDFMQMAHNLEQNPPKYATIKGERNVDGFVIREVKN